VVVRAGAHRASTEPRADELVLHMADDASYPEIVSGPAFRVVFASR
jgi:hypothetical protein